MSDHDLADHRKLAIELAQTFGWRVTRKNSTQWSFTQPDTGGLWDVFTIPHDRLSVDAVMQKLEAYELDLRSAVFEATNQARAKWLHSRRPATASKFVGAEQ